MASGSCSIVPAWRRTDTPAGARPGQSSRKLFHVLPRDCAGRNSVYNGPNLRDTLAKFGNWTIEIVKRAADATGFQLLPRRWVVERTLAWLNRNRRLAKDFEATVASAKAWIYIASVQLLLRRLSF